MKYVRYDAPPELRLRFHFRDKFGQDIQFARDYDPETGIGHFQPPGSDALVEFFKPNGYVEIDGKVNPNAEVLSALFENSKMVISNPDALDKIAKQVSQDVRYEQGLTENNPAEPTEPLPQPEPEE